MNWGLGCCFWISLWSMKTSQLTRFLCLCVFALPKVSRHERRISQIEQLNLMPLYPTEKIIWDENIVPTEYYSGEGACQSQCMFRVSRALACARVHSQVWAFHSERRCWWVRVHTRRKVVLLWFKCLSSIGAGVQFLWTDDTLYRCQITADYANFGLLACWCALLTFTGWSSQAAWLCPSWTFSSWPSTTTCWETSTSFAWSPPMRSDRT